MPRVLIVFQLLLGAAVCASESVDAAGAYVFGHEVRSFQPCGSSRVYWVKPTSPGISAALRKHHRELAASPCGQIYVVVSGRPSDEGTAGFAQSYDGYFAISEVLQAAGKIPPNCTIR